MTGLVDRPVLDNGAAGGVLVDGLGVGVAVGNPSGCGCRLVSQAAVGLRDRLEGVVGQAVRVDGGNYAVLVAVEDDQGNAVDGTGACRRPLVDGRERGGDVVGGATGQAGMNACGGVQVRVGRAHDGRHGSSGGQAGHVDATLVNGVGSQDLPGDPGDEGGFAGALVLVRRLEPVPVPPVVGDAVLLRVGHEEGVPLGQLVHPCAGREVVSGLRAAVQHHDQRDLLPGVAGGNVEL